MIFLGCDFSVLRLPHPLDPRLDTPLLKEGLSELAARRGAPR